MSLLTLSPQEQAVGTYLFSAVSMTRWRLKLNRDGHFCLEAWRDMGGFWHVLNTGRFRISDGHLLFERDFLSPYRMEYGLLTAPMVLRQLGQDCFWVPQRYLADFDRKCAKGLQRDKFVYLEHGLFCFLKQNWPKLCICFDPYVYSHALTLGQRYLVLEERTDYLRLFGDHGRLRWFPRFCFNQPAEVTSLPERSLRQPRQGDLYWVRIAKVGSSEPGVPHPHVVIQDDLFNRSRLGTVVLCALTSNRKRAQEPGNVLLEAGEGGLAKSSVVVVSQLETACKSQLGGYIGTLSPERVAQILAGLRFQQRSFFGYHSD